MGKFRKRTIRKSKISKQRSLKKTSMRLKSKKSKRTMRYNYGGTKDNTIIIMMWMEGCGHCILLNKSWVILKEEMKSVKFIEMESRNLDYDLLKKYNIESPHGFPTLVKIKDGIVCEEPTSRDIDDLRKWIKS
jgi:thiol-disulfide isomerase/thioredoxin